jgi:hypothetical protein
MDTLSVSHWSKRLFGKGQQNGVINFATVSVGGDSCDSSTTETKATSRNQRVIAASLTTSGPSVTIKSRCIATAEASFVLRQRIINLRSIGSSDP